MVALALSLSLSASAEPTASAPTGGLPAVDAETRTTPLGLPGHIPTGHIPTGPHARHAARYGGVFLDDQRASSFPSPGPLPAVTPGPDMRVYGYLAYWDDDLNAVPWDDITDIAIFSAGATSTGELTDTSRWDIADEAVLMAAPYGVRVHLCITNFDPSSLETLLSSATYRDDLIDELVDWVAATGAHGVNVDFEGVPYAVRDEMVDFVADLDAVVDDVVLATPSVDWSSAWDYDALSQHADLFIMGYGYHWGGSSYAGPTDPLYAGSGTVWDGIQSYSLSRSVDDYTDPGWGADPSRVILGLPLYGMSWPTSSNAVPSSALGSGSSVFFRDAWVAEATHGRNWEAGALSPYTHDGSEQIWYGDDESVRDRIVYARDQTDVGGIGFWALHYDDDDLDMWTMIREETHWGASGTETDTSIPTGTSTTAQTTDGTSGTGTSGTSGTGGTSGTTTPDPPGDPDYRADAGLPFLAYVGDTIVLTSAGSTGPNGVELQYRWSQLSGPLVELSSTTDAEPVFRVDRPGTHVFELIVGNGSAWSAPARSYLIVVDPDLPNRHEKGCNQGGGSAIAGLWLLLAAVRRRTRRSGARP